MHCMHFSNLVRHAWLGTLLFTYVKRTYLYVCIHIQIHAYVYTLHVFLHFGKAHIHAYAYTLHAFLKILERHAWLRTPPSTYIKRTHLYVCVHIHIHAYMYARSGMHFSILGQGAPFSTYIKSTYLFLRIHIHIHAYVYVLHVFLNFGKARLTGNPTFHVHQKNAFDVSVGQMSVQMSVWWPFDWLKRQLLGTKVTMQRLSCRTKAVHVCMYVCLYVCMYVCMYVCI
jgi:hypothetical protein